VIAIGVFDVFGARDLPRQPAAEFKSPPGDEAL
jgi:hypothetical protein